MVKTKSSAKLIQRRSVRIRGVKDCKRLLARLIKEYQEDLVSENKLRTLTYAISKYVDIERVEKLEEITNRLDELEAKTGAFNGNN